MEEIPERFKIIDVRLLRSRSSSVDLYPPNPNFARELDDSFHTFEFRQSWRIQKYGNDIAQEFCRGLTPQDARDKYRLEQEEAERLYLLLPTPDYPGASHITTEVQSPNQPSKRNEDFLSEAPTDSIHCTSQSIPRRRPYPETQAKKDKNRVGKRRASKRSSAARRRRQSNGDSIPVEEGVPDIPDGDSHCQNQKTKSTALVRGSCSPLNDDSYRRQPPRTKKDSSKKDTFHNTGPNQIRKELLPSKPTRKAHQRIMPNRVVKTRKGRVSRKPERWVPDEW